MTRDELRQVIAEEVQKQLRPIVQKSVKPLVQEAVAGALAGLLADGIVNAGASSGANKRVLGPNVPRIKENTAPERNMALSGAIPASTRRKLADKMGYGDVDRIGTNVSFGNTPVSNILEQTAMEMHGGTETESILDAADVMDSVTTPDVVAAITKDYSALMARMKSRGMISG